MTITSSSDYWLIFEGIRGSGYRGDIAIDDVEILDNACSHDCDFEADMCTWLNVPRSDDFDWLRGSGSTPSSYTGPSTDHSTNSPVGKSHSKNCKTVALRIINNPFHLI